MIVSIPGIINGMEFQKAEIPTTADSSRGLTVRGKNRIDTSTSLSINGERVKTSRTIEVIAKRFSCKQGEQQRNNNNNLNQPGSQGARGYWYPDSGKATPVEAEIFGETPSEWAKLPPKLLDMFIEGKLETVPAEYREIVRKYYIKLAEKK